MKISIVTPSYNQQKWLDICYRSVHDELLEPDEHLIQEGFEVESSYFEKRYALSKIFIEPDKGMYDALNKGFAHASGDIFGWLNCDEQYLPGALSLVRDHFVKHPQTDVLVGDALMISPEGELLSYRRATLPSLSYLEGFPLPLLSCALFFSGEIARKFQFDISLKAEGDAEWFYRVLSSGPNIKMISTPLGVYTHMEQNLSRSEKAKSEHLSWVPAKKRKSLLQSLCCKLFFCLRKLANGAYFFRNVKVSIYRLGAGDRKACQASFLSPFWPS